MVLSEAQLSRLLLELDGGAKMTTPAAALCAALGIGDPLSDRDVRVVRNFAARFGCAFEYDAFGHYEPFFRKQPSLKRRTSADPAPRPAT
jgi:hypothetical protein